MIKFLFRLFRWFMIASLGAALAAKFLLESNAEPTTEEIDLVSIFDGRDLKSVADPFYGGKILAMFGGVMLDLRGATPAPTGVYLDVAVCMGGVSLIVPEGWRVKCDANLMLGGFSDVTRTTADDEVPTVYISGTIFMAGLQATNQSPVKATVS
ncbi:MAG: hypothetical protein PVG83_13875 [Acidimicrobiia bacterium]|jgi:hypothetical protein